MSGLILEGFAGPGGWSTGLALLGRHQTAIGVELDQDACCTAAAAGYRRIRGDVATIDLTPWVGRVDGVILSPPCQAFSRAGKRQGIRDQDRLYAHIDLITHAGRWVPPDPDGWADPRSPLVLQPLRWVSVLWPRWVALEQVPDVLPLWRAVAGVFRGWGYSTAVGVLSAEQYGVPQTRQRAVLVAKLEGGVRLPPPTHQRYVPNRAAATADGQGGLFDPPVPVRPTDPTDRGLLPWVSMADALGWVHDRPSRTVACSRSPRWAYGAGARSYRTGWTLTTNNVPGGVDQHQQRDATEPASAVTGSTDRWVLQTNQARVDGTYQQRPTDDPAAPVTGQGRSWSWVLHTNRDQRPDGSRQTREPPGPAPTVTAKSGGQWVLEPATRTLSEDRTRPRPLDAPATTVLFGRSNIQWVLRTSVGEPRRDRHTSTGGPGGTHELNPTDRPCHVVTGRARSWQLHRPATTVQGDPRIWPPGHKVNADDVAAGRSGYGDRAGTGAIRVEPWQAGVLQSFPPDYPWQGTRTAQFRQVGDAVPPLLAAAVLGELLGVDWRALLWPTG